ncbi:MAG: pilin, partial [Planctomycetes bacterium]|nr:pilin [Planctomycetota bacterium]
MFFSRRSKIIIAFLISAATVWLVSDFALAQTLNTGINDTNVTSIGLASFDLKVFVVRIIQIVLGFLGLISVVLVIYAGFTWMTSGGNEEKIANAKKTLRNALIGLVIIFSSFGIATYVINRLLNATGVQEEMLVDQKMKAVNTGLGVAGSCTVESLLPEAMQKGLSRNSLIMVMFKEPVDPKTFCSDATCTQLNPSAVRIYKNVDGDSCPEGVCQSPNKNFLDAKVFAADNNRTIIISPNTYLGSSSDNIWYTVHLSNDIKAATGKGIFSTCSINYLEWSFEVSSTIDTVPPKIAGVFPPTDNTQDTVSTTVAKVAKGLIAVASSPKTYTPASVLSVTKVGSIPSATAVMSPDYHDTDTVFKVDVTGNGSKAQLFVVSGTKTLSLGTTDINPGTK